MVQQSKRKQNNFTVFVGISEYQIYIIFFVKFSIYSFKVIESSSRLRAIKVTTLQGLNKNNSVTSMYSCGSRRCNDRRRQRYGSGASRSATSFFLFFFMPSFAGVRRACAVCMWMADTVRYHKSGPCMEKRKTVFPSTLHTPSAIHLRRVVCVYVRRDAIVGNRQSVHVLVVETVVCKWLWSYHLHAGPRTTAQVSPSLFSICELTNVNKSAINVAMIIGSDNNTWL